MAFYNLLIAASWLVLIAYWVRLAARAKHTVRRNWLWLGEIGLRLVILALVLLALHLFAGHHALRANLRHAVNTNLIAGFFGAALCASGVMLAVWARVHLGRNWGFPMDKKACPEFIADGPYAYIRHPIYAGLILAMLGSAIGQTVLWAIPLLSLCPYFVYSAYQEEKLMTEQFPRQYPAYMKHTKMLIPFIL